MEPRQQSHEQLPPLPAQPESLNLPGEGQETAETRPNYNEATERRLGHQVEAAAQFPAQLPASSLPAPVAPAPIQPTDDANAIQAVTPLVAGDEDLIEKEWVDKAKKIIAETKDDPYRREEEVKKLQIEYVRKRYGRIIGDDGDDN